MNNRGTIMGKIIKSNTNNEQKKFKLQKGDLLILGAGFSYSFANTPLMSNFLEKASNKDFYNSERHTELSKSISHYFGNESKINIEKLATFLISDLHTGIKLIDKEVAYEELLEVVKNTLNDAWRNAKKSDDFKNAQRLAKKCVDLRIPIISFNYDLIFDNLLLETEKWNPVFGYGTELTIAGESEMGRMDLPPLKTLMKNKNPNSILLKLHGSLNWGIRKIEHPDGSQPIEISPNILASIKGLNLQQSENNFEEIKAIKPIDNMTQAYGIPGSPNYYYKPFFIPPLSQKGSSYKHPFIKNIWYMAHQAISKASRIFIVGYSLPEGDYEVSNLLREALAFNNSETSLLIIDPSDNVEKRFKDEFGFMEGVKVERIYKDCSKWLQEEY